MKKRRNLVIDRYFLKFQELPHEIKKTNKNIYECTSGKHKAIIEIKEGLHIEAILFDIIY